MKKNENCINFTFKFILPILFIYVFGHSIGLMQFDNKWSGNITWTGNYSNDFMLSSNWY